MERINAWLARLKISHKLILSGALFGLPIVVLLTYVTREYDRGIRTCEREVAGTMALEVCPPLLHDLRVLQAREELAGGGGAISQDDLAQVHKRVDDAVTTLRGAEGATTKRLASQLGGLWTQVQERGEAVPSRQRAAIYAQMVDTASQLVSAILDDSSLILDSELRTYYTMSLGGPLLLQAQAAVAEARNIASKASSEQRPLDQRDVSQLHAQSAALANTIIPRMRYSVETAVREDTRGAKSSFQQNVPPLFERYVERVSDLSSSINRVEAGPNTASPRERITATAVAAENAGVSLGSKATSELRTLLLERIAEDKRSRAMAWLLSLFCIAVATGVMVAVTVNITRPLTFLVRRTADIASGRIKEACDRRQRGEFRTFVPDVDSTRTRDEICQLIRSVSAMTESLHSLVSKVVQASDQVARSATQMTATVRQVEAAVSEQAVSTDQVSATSKQIDATARELARRMAGVTSDAQQTAKTAREEVAAVEGIRSALDDLIRASRAMNQTFNMISEKTEHIDRIIAVITNVANRTNLLSLNAAIEAEKEGKKAGGFSVVSVEMRRLADQTAVAALDIEKQIRNVQQAIREGVCSVDSYAGETRAKSSAVTELSSGLEHVIESATKLAPEFEAVNRGVRMQSEGAGQIADAMQQLRQAASQTRDSLAQFRQMAEDLQRAVRDMQIEVGRFAIAS